MKRPKAHLLLEDGTVVEGEAFGATTSVSGEVVFNTGMVGYPESMTDPSYRGQILCLTYPLIGNYGIRANGAPVEMDRELAKHFESGNIQIKGLVVSSLSDGYSHWSALDSLDGWMKRNNIPGITGIDTRSITKRLRTEGCMLGKLVAADQNVEWDNPNQRNLVAEVSAREPRWYHAKGDKKVVLVDFGVKNNIVRSLLARGVNVFRVPWDYDWVNEDVDGVLLSNGPGDPKMCTKAIEVIRRGLDSDLPIFGICLGNQLLALAAGGDTYKLKYGHRSQNQPCIQVGSKRCFVTSQNHGYAVNEQSLNSVWQPWFFNANDGTNEGIRHNVRPIFSVQFHPEASPGPSDTNFLFDTFLQTLNHAKQTT
jgi:carbamoyl-phosphate synthase small subunit